VKGKKLIDFIKWAIHDGENDAAALDYGPLPRNVVAMLDKRLTMVKNIASKWDTSGCPLALNAGEKLRRRCLLNRGLPSRCYRDVTRP